MISPEEAKKKLEDLEVSSGTRHSTIDPIKLAKVGKMSRTRPKPSISQIDGDPE